MKCRVKNCQLFNKITVIECYYLLAIKIFSHILVGLEMDLDDKTKTF